MAPKGETVGCGGRPAGRLPVSVNYFVALRPRIFLLLVVVDEQLDEALRHSSLHLFQKCILADEVFLKQRAYLHILFSGKSQVHASAYVKVHTEGSSALHWCNASVDVLAPVDVEFLDA